MEGPRICREGSSGRKSVSLRTSLIAGTRLCAWFSAGSTASAGFNHSNGTVRIYENLIRHATDVGLTHLVNVIDGAEQLTPIAVARLISPKLYGQALVVGEAANQV